MWKRVRKPPTSVNGSVRPTHFSNPPAKLSDFGFEIEVLPDDGLDRIINSKSRLEFSPRDVRFATSAKDDAANEHAFLMWEEISYSILELGLQTLTGPQPPPELTTQPVHWTERPGGFGLEKIWYPRHCQDGGIRSQLLASPNLETASRLVVFFTGGQCALGGWNRNLMCV